jgi:hypothetical protein
MRLIAISLWLASALPAQNGAGWSWGAEVDFNSRYLWRGLTYSRGPVMQPWVWITSNRTTVSLWSSMVLNNEPRRGRFDQAFFSAARENRLGRWKIESALQGYYWQGFSGEANAKTLELSFRASRPVGPLGFFTSHTVDIGGFPGSYIADAGLEARKRFLGLDWDWSGMAAWANSTFNRNYIGVERHAVNYTEWSMAVTKRGKHGWYVRPHAEFVIITGASIRRAVHPKNILNAGLVIGRN